MSENVHLNLLSRTKRELPFLNQIIQKNGVITVEPARERNLFIFLAKTVVGQQVSSAAANTIWMKISNVSLETNLEIEELFNGKHTTALSECGLARYKVKAITGIKKEFDAGTLGKMHSENSGYAHVVEGITSLWGMGKWSADIAAINYFGFKDVWIDDDATLKKAIKYFTAKEGKSSIEILETVTPYKSYVAKHMWKAIDNKIIY